MEPYRLSLDAFEGPLDLLLHLIVTQEVDIHQIPLARITDQYLALLQDSIASSMDVASEFIVMAATLIEIKAKSLLPRRRDLPGDDAEAFLDEAQDEEQSLAWRLLEYRVFKEAAQALRVLESDRALRVGRMPLPLDPFRVEQAFSDRLGDVRLTDLLAGLQAALRRIQPAPDVEVVRDRETVPRRMQAIERRLRHLSGAWFHDLLATAVDRGEIVTVFLAVLELVRLGRVVYRQDERFGAIWITLHP